VSVSFKIGNWDRFAALPSRKLTIPPSAQNDQQEQLRIERRRKNFWQRKGYKNRRGGKSLGPGLQVLEEIPSAGAGEAEMTRGG
jgi:hypothetical protein